MNIIRRLVMGASFVVLVLTGSTSAFAGESDMHLFKIISPKDDVVIGLSEAELFAAGGLNADTVGKMLVADGALAAWQYVVSRDAEGQLVQAPSSRISIIANDTLRIEPYLAEWPVVLPSAE